MKCRSCCWSSNSWNGLRLRLGQCLLYANGCGCHRSRRTFLFVIYFFQKILNQPPSTGQTKVFSAFSYWLAWSNTKSSGSASDDGRCALSESAWLNFCSLRANGQRSRPRHYLTFCLVYSSFVLYQKESS